MMVFQNSRTNYLTCQTWNLPPNIWNHLALKLLCCIRTTWIIACAYDEKPPWNLQILFSGNIFPSFENYEHLHTENKKTATQTHNQLNNKISLPFLSHLFPGVKTQVQQLQTPQLFYPPTSCHAASFGNSEYNVMLKRLQIDFPTARPSSKQNDGLNGWEADRKKNIVFGVLGIRMIF